MYSDIKKGTRNLQNRPVFALFRPVSALFLAQSVFLR